MTRRNVALAVVAVALGWRLVAAVAGAAEQIARPDPRNRPLGARLAAFDEPLAARRRRSLGFADPVFAAVEQYVPADAVLVARLEKSRHDELFSMALFDLLWPRRIFVTDGDLLACLPPDARAAEHVYALLLTDAAPLDPAQWEQVQGDRRYTLWRLRGADR